MIAKANCELKEQDRISDYRLQDVMNLGDLCLVGFPAPDEPDPPRFPLQLSYCKASELVQLRHTVAPELMFRTYWYNSSTNEAMVRHLKRVVLEARREVVLNEKDTVVDIGCNDGALLGHYPQYVRRIGFDPAKTVRPRTCDLFVNDFFSARMYAGNAKAKIVTSIAMFYDVDDPVKFAQEVYSIMHEDGVWVIEMHYLPMILEKNEVDAICHEHLCYYNLHSLSYVMRQAGLSIVRAEFNDTNGGSMLVFVKKSARAGAPSPDLQNQMAKEDRVPLLTDLMDFYVRCRQNKLALQELLTRLHGEGKSVLGYGASTKGSTLLQYCDIDKELLPAIADRNPRKWGREMPGNRIPIISEEEMRSLRPDYLLALPYHFIDSFMEREKDLLDKGCKFIVPVPEPAVIG